MLFLSAAVLVLGACSSNPHKAEQIETKINDHGKISHDTHVGIKDGQMIVQRKVEMNEEVRRLQNDVYEIEDKVFGNRKYGSLGLYGVLRQCRADLSDPANGGDGKLKWTEALERVTEKEEEWTIGLDEKEKLVGVSEEMLKDRIERFRNYKRILNQRHDEYEEKLQICKAELRAQKANSVKASN